MFFGFIWDPAGFYVSICMATTIQGVPTPRRLSFGMYSRFSLTWKILFGHRGKPRNMNLSSFIYKVMGHPVLTFNNELVSINYYPMKWAHKTLRSEPKLECGSSLQKSIDFRVGSIPGVWVTPFPKRVNSKRLRVFHDKLCDLHDGLREMMMSRNLLCKSFKLSWKSRNLLESTPELQLQSLESDSESES